MGALRSLPPPQPSMAAGGPWQETSQSDILQKLWRRRWLVAGLTALFVVVAYVVANLLPERYKAEAVVLVGVEKPRITNIEAVLQGLTPSAEIVQNERHVLLSRAAAQQVVDRLGLDQDPEFNSALRTEPEWRAWLDPTVALERLLPSFLNGRAEAASERAPRDPAIIARQREARIVNAVLRHVEATPQHRSHVLTVVAEAGNPETAANLANTFAEVYIGSQLTRKQEVTQRAGAWLDKRVEQLRGQVEKSERAVEEYRSRHGLFETRSDTVIAQQLGELNSQLIAAEGLRAEAQAKLAQARPHARAPDGGAGLPAVLQSALIQQLRQKHVELERQSAEMSAIYGARHPRMRDIRAQLDDVLGRIRTEVGRVIEGIEHEYNAANARYNAVRDRLRELEQQMGASNAMAVQLRDLEREAEANRVLLANFLERSRETAGQEEIAQPDATLVSAAVVPSNASFPPRALMLVLGAIIGGMLGTLLALLVEGLDRTFRSSYDVEELTGLPTLALVPRVRGRRNPSGVVLSQPESSYSDSLRLLSARLATTANASSAASKTILIASAVSGEGKSHTGVALARQLAASGHRVAIVDYDWKRPMLHRLFSRPRSPGLAELFRGEATAEDVVYRDPQSGAHVVFAGDVSQMKSDVLRFSYMRLLLRTLSKHYDVVLVDTPPVLVAPEALQLAGEVDRVLYFIKWGDTPREVGASGLKHLLEAGANVGGIVLSQVDPAIYRRYGYADMGYAYDRRVAAEVG